MSDYLNEFDLTIATLWREERISCPHRDLLQGFLEEELEPAQMDYVRFHLAEVGCEGCTKVVEDLGRKVAVEPLAISAEEQAVQERLLTSTCTFLGASRAARGR